MLTACIILQCSHINPVVWRSYMQTAMLGAPWKCARCLENLVSQTLQYQEWDICFILPGGTAASRNYGSGDGDGFCNVALVHLTTWRGCQPCSIMLNNINNDHSLRVLHCSHLIYIGILLILGNTVYFPGVRRPRHIIEYQLTFSVEVKPRVELYFYSPSGNSWRVLEQHFIYLFTYLFIYWFILFTHLLIYFLYLLIYLFYLFTYLFIYFIYLLVYLFTYLFTYLFILFTYLFYLFTYFIYLLTYLLIFVLFIYLFIYLLILFIYLFIYFIYLLILFIYFIYLLVYLFTYLFILFTYLFILFIYLRYTWRGCH